MKWLGRLLPILLLVALLVPATAVLAEEGGLDVDIVVIGDDADVGVDIHGDDAEVWINGQNLAEPTVIRIVDRRGASKKWVSKQLDQVIGPLYSWVDTLLPQVALTVDGLAKVIILAQSTESELEILASYSREYGEILDWHSGRLDNQDNSLADLRTEIRELDAKISLLSSQNRLMVKTTATSLEVLRAEYYGNFLILLVGFSVIVLALWVGLMLVARKRRINAL